MLIQFPILIAMFRFFPASIELRGEKLLWADDLSSYDSILNLPFSIPWYGDHVSGFALLMAGAHVRLLVDKLQAERLFAAADGWNEVHDAIYDAHHDASVVQQLRQRSVLLLFPLQYHHNRADVRDTLCGG